MGICSITLRYVHQLRWQSVLFRRSRPGKAINYSKKAKDTVNSARRKAGRIRSLACKKTIALMRKIFPFIPFPGIKPLTSGVWGPGPAMLIIFALCFFTLFCQAQNTPTQLLITGKVVDSLGTPVEGASIMIKGTSKGVLSDR